MPFSFPPDRDPTMSDERADDREPWHLDKRVNLGHLLTTLSLAVAIFAWGSAMDRRVAVLEEKAAAQRERDAGQDSAAGTAVILLRNELTGLHDEIRETNRKLDRIFERGSAR